MKNEMKRFLALGALAMMAMGFGATVAQTQDAAHAAVTSQRMIVDGDIGDGTSPTKKS